MRMPKQASQLLFGFKLLSKYSIDIIVLKDWSVASFVTSVDQEEYCVFLICRQEKYLQEKIVVMMRMSPGLSPQPVSTLPVNLFDFIYRKMVTMTLKLLALSTFVSLANAQLCLAYGSLRIRMFWRAIINSAVKSAQSE